MDLRNDIPPEARVEVTQAKYGSGGGGGRVITLDKNFIIESGLPKSRANGEKAVAEDVSCKIQIMPKNPRHLSAFVLSAKFCSFWRRSKDLTPLTPTAICFHQP